MNKIKSRQETRSPVKRKNTVSTLLLPSKYLQYFKQQCKQYGSQEAYFRDLITKFTSQLQSHETALLESKNDKLKTCYQNQELELHRRNFRPDPLHWEKFRYIANSFGVSMCYLFIFLLELELSGIFVKTKRKCRIYIKYKPTKSKLFFICTRKVDFFSNTVKRKLIYKC